MNKGNNGMPNPSDTPSKPSFTDLFAPKHTGVEQLRELTRKRQAGELLPLPEQKTKPRDPDLLEAYLGRDLQRLFRDAESRPSHYTPAQHALLSLLRTDATAGAPAQRSELLLQHQRTTAARETERTIRRNVTAPKLEKRPPPFERQDLFKGAIVLI
jgi:hypothetical protein